MGSGSLTVRAHQQMLQTSHLTPNCPKYCGNIHEYMQLLSCCGKTCKRACFAQVSVSCWSSAAVQCPHQRITGSEELGEEEPEGASASAGGGAEEAGGECRARPGASLRTFGLKLVSPPQEVHHSRRQIKYSKDKMWYLAKMVRWVWFQFRQGGPGAPRVFAFAERGWKLVCICTDPRDEHRRGRRTAGVQRQERSQDHERGATCTLASTDRGCLHIYECRRR